MKEGNKVPARNDNVDVNHQHETFRNSVKIVKILKMSHFCAITIFSITLQPYIKCILLMFHFHKIQQLNKPIPFQHLSHESPGTQTQGGRIGHNISLVRRVETTNPTPRNFRTIRAYGKMKPFHFPRKNEGFRFLHKIFRFLKVFVSTQVKHSLIVAHLRWLKAETLLENYLR